MPGPARSKASRFGIHRTWSWDVVRPAGEFAVEVRAACASVIGEEIVNAIWSGAGIRPPAGRGELLKLVEALLDPQTLILKLVQATAQVAAIHAGFPLPVAHLVGNLAQQICKGFLGQDPKANRVQAARCVDFAFSAQTGSWIGSSGLRELATDQNDVCNRQVARRGWTESSPPPSTSPDDENTARPTEGGITDRQARGLGAGPWAPPSIGSWWRSRHMRRFVFRPSEETQPLRPLWDAAACLARVGPHTHDETRQ